MKSLLFLLTLVISPLSFSLCGNNHIVLQAIISEELSDEAYTNQDTPAKFSSQDMIEVFEINNKVSRYLKIGTLTDDGAGNYDLNARSTKGEIISVYHDHETWHSEGLQGYYEFANGEKIDLSDIKCASDELFLFR